MESNRHEIFIDWVKANSPAHFISLDALPMHASFRAYSRLKTSGQNYIVMDAPPPQENIEPFIAIANSLRAIGLKTPEIFAKDESQGFMILSDFGDATFLKTLNPSNAHALYKSALRALATLQTSQHIVPEFDLQFMRKEWAWHKEWFLIKYLGMDMEPNHALEETIENVLQSIAKQPQVFMHRDFHSGNLMLLPNQEVGILDFQDAFMGPITYDLASLLRDCYIAWPEENVYELVRYYFELLQNQGTLKNVTLETFKQWFDFMSIQRHLKALMTFARKAVRDNQTSYLSHIPRTLDYLLNVSEKYAELKPLHDYLMNVSRLCEL